MDTTQATNECENIGIKKTEIDAKADGNIDLHNMSNSHDEQYHVDCRNNDDVLTQLNDCCVGTKPEHHFESDEVQLSTLPAELLLHICCFLEAKFVINVLSKVSDYFHSLLNDETFWKVRIRKRWPKKYPAISVTDTDFNWQEACIQREDKYQRWKLYEENMEFYRFTRGLYAPVDTVHFMKNGHLVSGSRDRYLNVLDTSKLESGCPNSVENCAVFTKADAHKGWIWSLASHDNSLATSSWDANIKFWDVGAEIQEVRRIKCKSAVLCSHYEPNYFVAGSYDKTIYHIDPRNATLISRKRYHQKPVLCLAMDSNYILTGSEDCTVVIYDRRADKIYKSLVINAYPMSLSYGMDQLWVGDKLGNLHLIDATNADFNLVETYDIGHKGKLMGVIHTLGAIYTCCSDTTIKILEPSVRPDVIATLSNSTAEVAEIALHDNTLASAGSDISIGIWKPKTS